jgi:hypothetical protein
VRAVLSGWAALAGVLVGSAVSPSLARAETPADAHAPALPAASDTAASDKAAEERALPRAVRRLSSYERDTVSLALPKGFAEVDPEPEGKIVESIQTVRLDVLEARDPVPGFARRPLNALHSTTRERIVLREVLVKQGEPFAQMNLDETERNLRRLAQLSLAVGLALRGSAPNKVRVLVITKDVWSLRLNYDISVPGTPRFGAPERGVVGAALLGPAAYFPFAFTGTSAGVENLTIRPSEWNLFGLHHTASLLFSYLPESFAMGASYKVPRFGTSIIGASAGASVILNNDRLEPEGFSLEGAVGQSLYTTRTDWAWSASGSYTTNVRRRYTNARLLRFGPSSVPVDRRVPFQYEQDLGLAAVSATRSYGWLLKNDLTLSFGVDARNYRTFDLTPYDARAVAAFLRVVPTSDTRVGPGVTYHTYTNRFHRITDFSTLGLQEDYRLGHDVYVRAYPVLEGLGSSRNFLGLFASAQYTAPVGNGLVRFSVETFQELAPERVYDAAIDLRLRAVTPRILGAGRLVFDAGVYRRFANYLRATSALGGDTRLRGYPTGAFIGQDLMLYNLEFRTRPITLWSLGLGGAVFYDVGDAFDGIQNLRPKQSTGVGFRLLIPQFNRVVFRGDLGFPLTRPLPAGASAVAFFFGFEQAFEFGSAAP